MSITAHRQQSDTGPADIGNRCPGSTRPGTAAMADQSPRHNSRDPHENTDADLLAKVRAGDVDAYAALHSQHVHAAHNFARQITKSSHDANDLVNEAFCRVLRALQTGTGPYTGFRAYLHTAIRYAAYDKARRNRKFEVTDDVTTASGVRPESISVTFPDTVIGRIEDAFATEAFKLLPERLREVLWFTEIRQLSPTAIAPSLGLTPNGVAALAYRARERLRQAYLQVQLDEPTGKACCRDTNRLLGAWCRNGLCKRDDSRVNDHLAECRRCRALAQELAEVNPTLVKQCA